MRSLISLYMMMSCVYGLVIKPNMKTNIKTFKYYGSTEPITNFDPLNILKNKSENRIKFTREAELQHGRLAMLATTIIPTLEILNKDSSEPGINYLSNLDLYHQAPFWLGLASYDIIRMGKGWVNPFNTNTTFMLKTDYQPGNLGNYNVDKISENLFNQELNNGRLAMLGFMGILGNELVTGKSIF